MKHEMQLTPDPFAMIKDGTKTIELRLYDEKRRKIQIGDSIVFTNTETKETMEVYVTDLSVFDSFASLYRELPLLECGYTEKDIDTASPDDMDMYYSKEKQQQYGVVGIKIEKPDHFRTNYENWYAGEDFYWGTEPAGFCDELIALCPPSKEKKVLDIGCGEGKDAVYMAQKGYSVSAFDLTENGIRKTIRLAKERGVGIHAYVDDINTFETDEQFDIVYSTGTIQYLFDENKKAFFDKIDRITKKGGFVFFNVFVEKPFLELPPDWDKEEKMWRSGELFSYFPNWKFHRIDEVIFEDDSNGILHYHCMDTIICEKME